MSPTLDAFLRSWPFDPWLTATLLLTAAIYLRGWRVLHRRDPHRWHVGRLAAFLGGLARDLPGARLADRTLRLSAAASPHGAAPAADDGRAAADLARRAAVSACPRTARAGAHLLGRAAAALAPLRRFFAWLTHPFVAWPIYVGVTWLWHMPRGYELGLSNNDWHFFEHACFIASGLLFWYPVVRPYPSRPRWSQWLLLPYLFLADVQNTVLAAWLTFSSDVLYPHYAQVPRLAGLSALDDQAAAGVLMWVPGSIAFLLPLFWIGVELLFDSEARRERAEQDRSAASTSATSSVAAAADHLSAARQPVRPAFDVLRIPLVGRFPALAILAPRHATADGRARRWPSSSTASPARRSAR